MAIKNIITLGLGCSPGSIEYLLTLGLDSSAVTGVVDLTLFDRSAVLTLESRSSALTLHDRSADLTLEER